MRNHDPAADILEGAWMIVIEHTGPRIIETINYCGDPRQWVYGGYFNRIPLERNFATIKEMWEDRH